MKKFIKDYFAFSKAERNGVFVLVALIFMLIMTCQLYPYFLPAEHWDFSTYGGIIDSMERISKEREQGRSRAGGVFDFSFPEQSVETSRLQPFDFFPDTMKTADWLRLGLTQRQAGMLEKYMKKGGRFRTRGDFKKMYCISEAEYLVLEPFIRLPEELPVRMLKDTGRSQKSMSPVVQTELNSAGEEELLKLKGIGNYFARKIITYREQLGGYIAMEQLLEIPKMDSARYEQISAQLSLNPLAIRKLSVNEASFESLSRHPYIGYNVALSLTNYRSQHGPFKELRDIRKSALVTEERFLRMSPYLKL
jgi:competence protein ComEA